MKKLYLLCNAHLDPVWLWGKREGIAEVISTFRVAANFCEEYFDTPDKSKLPVIEKSLVHVFPGCYTSMIRIKQQNRLMENKLAVCEKMYAHMGETPDAEFEKAEKAQMLL